MRSLNFYTMIKSLNLPAFSTEQISAYVGISNRDGYKLLIKLKEQGIVYHLRRGLWALVETADPHVLVDYLTYPTPCYLSLQSALYYHQMIDQIPSTIYAVSLARTRQYITPIGIYSIHHIDEKLFYDFDFVGENQVRIATPEKALFDFFYLKPTKTHLFYALPELTTPPDFQWKKLQDFTLKIKNLSRRQMVQTTIERAIRQAPTKRRAQA
jgi:predicted transcriptional regulator of viral defense system